MNTRSAGPQPGDTGDDADLVFATHDLGRDEPAADGRPLVEDTFVVRDAATPVAAATHAGFVLTTAPAAPAAAPAPFHVTAASNPTPAADAEALPWTVRSNVPAPTLVELPVTPRYSEKLERTAEGTLRRLRQEAVDVSWSAAWLAVTSASPRARRRHG